MGLPGKLTKFGAPTCYLQKAQDHVLFVFAHDQIVRFEQQALDDL